MDTSYFFSDADVQAAFDALEPSLFDKARSIGADGNPQPSLLVVAGAQGSGKTWLLEKTLLPAGRHDHHVRLYLPEFRKLHPQYEAMQPYGVLHVYEHTETFIWTLGNKILGYAFENRYNIIMEAALDNLGFAQFPPAAVAAGYLFEVHIIASQKEFSHWSTLDRGVNSVAADELERFVPLLEIEKSQANARAIIDALEEACVQAPGSEISLYRRDLETGKQLAKLCRSRCEEPGKLLPLADDDGAPFAGAPDVNPSFEIRRTTQANLPCSFVQYSQVVYAGVIRDEVRQGMVQCCCQTLGKAQGMVSRLPASVFRELSVYILKYAHP